MRIIPLMAAALLGAAPTLDAQSRVEGSISHASTGSPVAGATVSAAGASAVSDGAGRYRLEAPAGPVTLTVARVGFAPATRLVQVPGGSAAQADFSLTEAALVMDEVVVSATREAQRLGQTAASVGVVGGADLRAARPTHPADVMARIPGVWVSVTGGEGHMTAIRQPRTTSPVFLFLEDGVPTRSTGFFNHNALYEVNVPAAERIEVLKGPATALYGSDAIGGVVNVETRAPGAGDAAEASAEGSAFGWSRVMGSASGRWSADALRAEVNLTQTDGWRNGTAYDRQTASLRWDHLWADASLRTVASFSSIDQQTAGASTLSDADYRDHPTLNYTPVSFRNVRAFRLSSAYQRAGARTLLSVTPFVRWNEMELLPNWSLTYDPTVYTTGHRSLGVLARYRVEVEPLRTRLIAGVDVDHSPGFREEDLIQPQRTGDGNRFFTGFEVRSRVYDYDVNFGGVSPYLQAEAAPHPAVRVVAGLRYDRLGYDYRTRQASVDTVRYRVLEDTTLSYRHLSPKLGVTWEAGAALNLFATFSHGFRAPSEGQVFRPGRSVGTAGLAPVRANSYEAGARGTLPGRIGYSISAYRMEVSDDILTFQHADNSRETVNAGRTRHEGVELGLGAELVSGVRADLSMSRARHGYRDWRVRPTGGAAAVDYSGLEMENAPRDLWNTRLSYAPHWLAGARVAAEWQHVGSYWLDAENTARYPGHDLVNLTALAPVGRALEATLRVNNLTDARYAESTTWNAAARAGEYAPGMPTTLYAGLRVRLGR